MYAYLLTLTKMATVPSLVLNCCKRKKSASGVIISSYHSYVLIKHSYINKAKNGKIK